MLLEEVLDLIYSSLEDRCEGFSGTHGGRETGLRLSLS